MHFHDEIHRFLHMLVIHDNIVVNRRGDSNPRLAFTFAVWNVGIEPESNLAPSGWFDQCACTLMSQTHMGLHQHFITLHNHAFLYTTKNTCPGWGSNSRPSDFSLVNLDYETDALPTALPRPLQSWGVYEWLNLGYSGLWACWNTKQCIVAGFEPLLLCETKESIADGSLVSIQGYRQL